MTITGPGFYERAEPVFDRRVRTFDPVASLVSTTVSADGRSVALTLATRSGATAHARVTFPDPEVCRYQLRRDGEPSDRVSEMLTGPAPALPLTVDESDPAVVTVAAGGTPLIVTRAPFRLAFGAYEQDADDGNIIEWVNEPGGFAADVDSGKPYTYETFGLRPGEELYGLGERFAGPGLRGRRLSHWIEEAWGQNTVADRVYKSVPLVVSSRGYGLFFHHPEEATFDLGAGSVASAAVLVHHDELDLFVVLGQPKDVLRRYTALTGRPPQLPEWAYGVWMSRAGYTSRAEVEEIVTTAEKLDFPIDVVNVDPYWLTLQKGKNYNVCDFIWNTDDFGDPRDFVGWLHDHDVRLCLWVNTFVSDDSPAWRPERLVDGGATKYDVFPYEQAWVDLTDGPGREWWLEELTRLVGYGVDAFKLDYSETLPEGFVLNDGRRSEHVHNIYPLLCSTIAAEAGAAVHFTRSGTAGSQRHPLHWSGDAQSTWSGLRGTLRGGLSLAWSGFAHWSHDIGGFFRRDLSVGDDIEQQMGFGQTETTLYIRWMQFGLLCSESRFHGMAPREPWQFGDEALDIARAFADLRRRLLPYLVRCGAEAAETGCPIMRPVAMEFPDDPGARHVDTEYLLGPSLLVCPVLDPGGDVEAYIPPGRWTDHFTGESYVGPAWVRWDAVPIDRVPLLVREGHDPFGA